MDRGGIALALAVIDLACWVVCFAWMHRISKKQSSVLDEIHAQGKRIEGLSRVEHDLIKEVHPQVGEIRESMKEVAEVVANAESAAAADGKTRD